MRMSLLLVVLGLVVAAGCGGGGGERPLRLTYSVFFPPTHAQAELAKEWAEEVERRSEGRVKVVVFAGGALTKADQCYQGVVDGVSDIGMSAFAYTRGRFPLMEAFDLPLGYPDGVAATRIANSVVAKFRPVELGDTELMYVHAHGPGILASKKRVGQLGDMKGLKVRATGFCTKVVESLGGAPVSMPQGETYEALQKGVVDATFCPIETLKGWKQGEVVSHVVESQCIGYTTVFFVTMNRERWESLPGDVQEVIRSVNSEWIARHGEAWNRADSEGREYVQELGRELVELSAAEQDEWKRCVAPLIEEYQERAGEQGLKGGEVVAEIRGLIGGS